MKFNKWIIALAALAAVALGTPALAQDTQGYPQTFITLTNQPATVATATTATNYDYVVLRKGQGLGLQWMFDSSAGTSNAWISVYPSIDGTNYATTGTSLVGAANGTNYIVVSTNWSPSQLAGIYSFKIGAMANAGSSGVLTNKGVIVNRPNAN